LHQQGAHDLAAAVMRLEAVPDISLFRKFTVLYILFGLGVIAAFISELTKHRASAIARLRPQDDTSDRTPATSRGVLRRRDRRRPTKTGSDRGTRERRARSTSQLWPT
jgi:hypothetical protein